MSWVSPDITPLPPARRRETGLLVMSTPAMALNKSSASKVAVPRECVIQLARIGLGERDQLPDRFRRHASFTSTTSGIEVNSATGSESRCEWSRKSGRPQGFIAMAPSCATRSV